MMDVAEHTAWFNLFVVPAREGLQVVAQQDGAMKTRWKVGWAYLRMIWVGVIQVTDLGAVLHMVGGTAASYMIFFLPGLLLINAAIVKRTASMANLADEGQVGHLFLSSFSSSVSFAMDTLLDQRPAA